MKTKILALLTAATLAFIAPADADHVTKGTLFTNLVFTNAGTFTVTGGNIIRLPKDTGVALLPTSARGFLETEDHYELRWSFSVDAVKWTSPVSVVTDDESPDEAYVAEYGFGGLAGTLASPKRDYQYFPRNVFGAVVYARIAEIKIPTGNTNFVLSVDYSFSTTGRAARISRLPRPRPRCLPARRRRNLNPKILKRHSRSRFSQISPDSSPLMSRPPH